MHHSLVFHTTTYARTTVCPTSRARQLKRAQQQLDAERQQIEADLKMKRQQIKADLNMERQHREAQLQASHRERELTQLQIQEYTHDDT